ncbi:hypothetical protein CF386_04920 [Paraphotobacterium marinum]|uniref:NADH-quinone oxidoreductase subunit N n=2 Tax=Paraphotobacterium marinum TaxID=1755811 RepID=A0A220VEP5_9GAMM|nr:NADH-quinone oxidoreductase subunit N [Paraphotobacterium marinum]ASK78393.1 hypothetical protein CF386_04920 [Paraphotobacterium marinum]
MMSSNILDLLPIMLTGLGGLLVLLIGVWPGVKSSQPAYITTIILLGLAILYVLRTDSSNPSEFENLIRLGTVTTKYFWALFCLGGIFTVTLANSNKSLSGEIDEIFYSLILFAVTGALVLSSSVDLLASFIGMELSVISILALIAWQPKRFGAIEAAIKFAITATIGAAIFLLGIALIYSGTGTTYIPQIVNQLQANVHSIPFLVYIGIGLIIAGIAFDIAIVPFHTWLPDVFQGASDPVVAFIGSVGKIAMLIFLLNFAIMVQGVWFYYKGLIWTLGILSILIGSIMALKQNNLRRILAYSSVSHFGYVFLVIATISPNSQDQVFNDLVIESAMYYGLAYSIMNIVCFGVLNFLNKESSSGKLAEYRGLGRKYPILGFAFALSILSLAGFPPTAGFIAKYNLFMALIAQQNFLSNSSMIFPLIIAVIGAAISIFYYLRVLITFFNKPEKSNSADLNISSQNQTITFNSSFGSVFTMIIGSLSIVFVGLAANPIILAFLNR